MNDLILSSSHNPRIKEIIKLRDRKDRDMSGTFLIEGYREILRAITASWKIQELFYCPELFLGTNEAALLEKARANGARLVHCKESLLSKITYRDRPDGLLAVALQKHYTLKDLETPQKPHLLLVAEAIEKPGNLGTMLRSADAVGATGVIICDRCTDIFNPNVVRASVGTLFTVPVVETTSSELLQWLRLQKVVIAAATPAAILNYTESELSGPIAIAVGTEQLGLSDFWLREADLKISIPMRGSADSLNVATAATLLLYEVLRQRNRL